MELHRWVECPCREHPNGRMLGQMLSEVYDATKHDMWLLAWAYHNPHEARQKFAKDIATRDIVYEDMDDEDDAN